MPFQHEKCERFEALLAQDEAFIIPNPWTGAKAADIPINVECDQ